MTPLKGAFDPEEVVSCKLRTPVPRHGGADRSFCHGHKTLQQIPPLQGFATQLLNGWNQNLPYGPLGDKDAGQTRINSEKLFIWLY